MICISLYFKGVYLLVNILNLQTKFNSSTLKGVFSWNSKNGSNLLYIYDLFSDPVSGSDYNTVHLALNPLSDAL